jgi:aspartyl-tRNA(Asn)/glutamyl-tRNA(Gln) amidotransferase subunit B
MSQHGWLEISDNQDRFAPKRVGITRAHLEDDAGKSTHDEAHGQADSEIDLNRTGTPLLEIVSEPDLRSAAEARAYLEELKLLLLYLEVSDCNMQEGSLRCDANVNLHIDTPAGQVATPIVEIKNMNSFRAVERAIEYEAQRQERVWQETGQKLGEAAKQTRGWDDAAGKTLGQRSKEESSDYRYFPDPDLVPVLSTPAEVEAVRAELGELPAALRTRLTTTHGLSPYDAEVLVNQGRQLLDYFLTAADASNDYKATCNWVTQDILRILKEQEIPLSAFSISAAQLAELVSAVNDNRLPKARSKEAFQRMQAEGIDVAAAIEKLGIEQVDESALVALCQALLDANPQVVADLQAGKQQAVGALIGQAKKKNPNVDPGRFRQLCLELVAKT